MILMYHHVCPESAIPGDRETQVREGWQFTLTPEEFAFQLATLRRQEFRFVSLHEYVETAVVADAGPGSMVAVTFDDGWVDNHTFALPVLLRLGIPATFFVVSGEMEGVPAERRMTHSMLREMIDAGMTIGGHTRTHPDLSSLAVARLEDEIRGCRADLERVIDGPVEFFAYPGGRFDGEVVRTLREAGFRAACSIQPAGRNGADLRFRLSRDVLTPRMATPRDRLLLHPAGRWLWRTARWARASLGRGHTPTSGTRRAR